MNVVIVEDEPVICERIVRMTAGILGGRARHIRQFHFLDDAEDYLADHAIDLLLLDLNLHGKDGFNLLQSMAAKSFHTIIISANDDKAIQAFEYGVLDFVPKPFTRERLSAAFDRLFDSAKRQDYGTKYLSINKAGAIELLEVQRIDFVAAAGHYSEIHSGESAKLHDKAIERLLTILPLNFERIHRSYIVNMDKVSHINVESGSKYTMVLKDGRSLPVSRTRMKEIRRTLAHWGK